jgi:hypothetical protein
MSGLSPSAIECTLMIVISPKIRIPKAEVPVIVELKINTKRDTLASLLDMRHLVHHVIDKRAVIAAMKKVMITALSTITAEHTHEVTAPLFAFSQSTAQCLA